MVSKIIRADGVTELASVKSVTYHESVNADIDLRPGCVASSYLEVTCFGQQADAPTVGEALTYYQVVGSTETLIGIFYAEPSIPTKNSYSFIAYDAVHKLDADFSAWLAANQSVFPTTPYQLVSQACTLAGVTLGSSSWGYSTMEVNAFYADGLTCRNILQYAAEIGGSFVRCNTSGEVIFDWYSVASNKRIYPSSGTSGSEARYAYKESGLNYDNYNTSAIARVAVHPVGEDDVAYYYPTNVTSGNTLNITNNLMLYGKAASSMTNIATSLYNRMTALGTYRPMSVDMFPNECPFRCGDIVPVTDAQGVSFTTVIMEKTVTDSAVTLTSTGREVYGDYALDTAKQLVQLAADIVRINKLKVDWAEIGTAIIGTLEANGINADWINAGAFIVRDANNNIIFQADKDTKTVQMGGWSADKDYLSSLDSSNRSLKLGKGSIEFNDQVKLISENETVESVDTKGFSVRLIDTNSSIYSGFYSITYMLSGEEKYCYRILLSNQYSRPYHVFNGDVVISNGGLSSYNVECYAFTQSGSSTTISIENPSGWRTAIGLGDTTFVYTVSDVFPSVTSGYTVTEVRMRVWGKLVGIAFKIKKTTAGTVSSAAVATLASAYMPGVNSSATSNATAITTCYINTNGTVYVSGTLAANTEYNIFSTYILP